MGVDVEVLTGMPSYPTGRIRKGYEAWRPMTEQHDGVRIQRLPLFAYGGGNRWLRLANHGSLAASALAGVALTRRPDLVMVESPPLPLTLSAALIAKRHRAPLVMYVADLWPDVAVSMGALSKGALYRALRALESLAYRLAWRITVPTEGLYERLAAHPQAGPAKLLRLPNGVDPTVFRPMPRDDGAAATLAPLDRRALFLYAGTVGRSQALDVIVDTAVQMAADRSIGFVVIGDGPERERLRARADAAGLDNIRFVPSVPPGDVPRFLSLARATIVPLMDLPLFEATRPAKVLPSLACARPVIFCGRGEMARIITAKGCGLVVPPEDPAALVAAVRRLAEDAEGAAAMGERGRAFALAEFDFSGLVRGWFDGISAALPPPARSS